MLQFPDWVVELLEKVEYTIDSSSSAISDFNQLTLNEYIPGSGIAPHVDRHSSFGPVILVVNLGSGIIMDFKKPSSQPLAPKSKSQVYLPSINVLSSSSSSSDPPPITTTTTSTSSSIHHQVWIPARSILIMSGEARYAYTHGIRSRKSDNIIGGGGGIVDRGRRVSLTFRQVIEGGVGCECEYKLLCDQYNDF